MGGVGGGGSGGGGLFMPHFSCPFQHAFHALFITLFSCHFLVFS